MEPNVPDGLELQQLEQFACDIATRAGRLIVDERPPALGVAETKSSTTDVVTVMDQRSEALLRTLIEQHRPGDGLVGEEGDTAASETGITWVVDPIDGTVNYLYEIPAYAVSVAACVGDVSPNGGLTPVVGAVFNPVTQELFHARRGGGAYLGQRRLHVNETAEVSLALIGTGFGYTVDKRRAQAAVVQQLLPQVRDIRRGGSAALDLSFVAAGRLDAYYESGLNPWDLAAGQLIVTEAGGVVSGTGSAPAGTEYVAAGPAELVTALKTLTTS